MARKEDFTRAQKDWVRRNSGNRSRKLKYNEELGWYDGTPEWCEHGPGTDQCENLEVDHIIPTSQGGKAEAGNACLICKCEHVGMCPEQKIQPGYRHNYDE